MYFYLLMSKRFIVITLLCVSLLCMEFDKVLKDKNIIKVPRLIYFLFSIY